MNSTVPSRPVEELCTHCPVPPTFYVFIVPSRLVPLPFVFPSNKLNLSRPVPSRFSITLISLGNNQNTTKKHKPPTRQLLQTVLRVAHPGSPHCSSHSFVLLPCLPSPSYFCQPNMLHPQRGSVRQSEKAKQIRRVPSYATRLLPSGLILTRTDFKVLVQYFPAITSGNPIKSQPPKKTS